MMKYSLRLLLILLVSVTGDNSYSQKASAGKAEAKTDTTARAQAFVILQQRCNSCHRSDNPRRVFTAGNMETYAADIYRQVFVYRRMPRDAPASLSGPEKETLQRWLQTSAAVRRLK